MSDSARAIGPGSARGLLAVGFALSGFTALLYQIVWMRLALARFGVNTFVVATVLAVFMLGLAMGSVLAARVVARAETRFGIGPLRVYGLAELFGYYFPDGPERVRAASGRLRIVCDDGRRFLDRSRDTFDLMRRFWKRGVKPAASEETAPPNVALP